LSVRSPCSRPKHPLVEEWAMTRQLQLHWRRFHTTTSFLQRSFCNTTCAEENHAGDGGAQNQPPTHPRLEARRAEVQHDQFIQLTKLQRGALGSVGAAMASAGFGGLAWLHWPLLSPTSGCMLACGCGVTMLAAAASGVMQPKGQAKRKKTKPKSTLELKVLNDDVRLQNELVALKMVAVGGRWPPQVQAALEAADKASEKASKEALSQAGERLLALVKQEAENGASGESIRRRLRPRLFVFDFKAPSEGAAAARPQSTKGQLELLSSAVSFILAAASEHDEALLRLTSPGGGVATYGLAAAQLQRLRVAGVHLHVCVDTVAASGGYMMACVGNTISAAPFAMVGSIGVIAGVPNFHRILERNEIEFQQITAGKYKRTANILTPNTEEGLAKFREDVETIHEAFRGHVQRCRPQVDVDTVATGEVWLGASALERGLVDSLGTSEDLIRSKSLEGFTVVELSPAKKDKHGLARLLEGFGARTFMLQGLEITASHFGNFAKFLLDRVRNQSTLRPRLEAPGMPTNEH